MKRTWRDRIGRWLIRTGRHQLANHYALLVMRPDAQAHAEVYLPLWRERWTDRGGTVPGIPGNPPAGITADCGAMRLLGQAEGARPS